MGKNELINDFRNRLRDLLFYVNFPLAAIVSVFFRQAFFDQNSPKPVVSNLYDPVSINFLGYFYGAVMILLIFSPIILFGVSHLITYNVVKALGSQTSTNSEELAAYYRGVMFKDWLIVLAGIIIAYIFVTYIFKQPYLFVLFLFMYVAFFLGKYYILITIFLERRFRKV
ncbi:MAG: hypothetical protein HQL05_06620 [Nitrospirae bacterium]|uniref:hypothetical protein n=1 Tax=Candidatus Magnetobacterium casense TaxID=1455061 RepID=UPI00058B4C85|nr:hypothetical protein [Candidatus Magnetobacterium casensis]MBF0337491.1 hypothetical protein [Nitrospirota bacterium]